MKTQWLFLMLVSGAALLYEFMPTYRLESALEGNQAASAKGVVEFRRRFRKREQGGGSSDYFYDVAYRFDTTDQTIDGRYKCQCTELAHFRAGDPITIRYNLTEPEENRPAVVHYNHTWLVFGNFMGFGLIIAAGFGLLTKAMRKGTGSKQSGRHRA